MIDIDKAFENRWRIKQPTLIFDKDLLEYVKVICRDFFQAAWLLNHADEMDVVDADFETWWNLYQKKRGKEKCMKKWAKLSKKDRQACIAATPSYVASTTDVTYRKDPLTYLNGKCWNDEVYFRSNPDQQRQQRLASAAERIAEYTKDGK